MRAETSAIRLTPVQIKVKHDLETKIIKADTVFLRNCVVQLSPELRQELIDSIPFFLACLMCKLPDQAGRNQETSSIVHAVLHQLLGREAKIMLRA